VCTALAGLLPFLFSPPMDIILLLELAVLGAVVGFIAGMLGIGGGMLMVPFIMVILSQQGGFPPDSVVKIAIATSLATILFTSISSVRAHNKRGAVRWDIVRTLAPGILIGSLLGAQVAGALKGPTLALCFALFVGFLATQMLLDRKPAPTRQLPKTAGMFGTGGVIGVVSAIVGAGGGFISMPFMAWCNVAVHHAVATSAALGFPIALAGTLGYLFAPSAPAGLPAGTFGFVYFPALAAIAATSVITAPLGAKAAHAMPTKTLKKVFAFMLYAVSAYMLYKAYA
jgi:uncharacterized protein